MRRPVASERARKRTESPGLQLADLPQLGLDDGRRANEAAEAGAVGAENHRHVAGEIDGADGVGVVVNVGRMQSGFAAVFARPPRLGADQADAGAVGVVVHLPRRREEHFDVGGREEIGRAVRAVEYADLPVVAVLRNGVELSSRALGESAVDLADVQHIAGAQHAARMAAEVPRMKVLRLPRYSGTSRPPATARYARLPAPAPRPSRASNPA